jgi:RNA polymerase sigma factor (sigma-70 family)
MPMAVKSETPTIHVVDHDASSRTTLRALLRSLGYRVEEHSTARHFLEHAALDAAGLVITEQVLRDLTGGELHEDLKRRQSPLAVVFVTSLSSVSVAVTAMQRGAAGYLLKPAREQELIDVVNRAVRDSTARAAQQKLQRSVLQRLARLTPREREVLKQLINGMDYQALSARLGITKRTVEAHRRRIMEKMNIRTLPQLLHTVAASGWPANDPAESATAHAPSPALEPGPRTGSVI